MRVLGWIAGAAALAAVFAWLRLRADERQLAEETGEYLRAEEAGP